MRKLSLFDMAYRFCDDIFDFDFQCVMADSDDNKEKTK